MKVGPYFTLGQGGAEFLSVYLYRNYKYKLGTDMWQGHAKYYKDANFEGHFAC